MSPRPLAWPLALPLAIAGSQAAHAAGYALVEPHAHARAELLAETGHGYLQHLPTGTPAPAAADRIDPPRALLHGALARRAPAALAVIP